jgi:hypothetical protein
MEDMAAANAADAAREEDGGARGVEGVMPAIEDEEDAAAGTEDGDDVASTEVAGLLSPSPTIVRVNPVNLYD